MGRIKWVLLLMATSFGAYSQVNRYVVFLSDKAGVVHTTDQPQTFLSERAIQKRSSLDIPVTEQDLPVDTTYLRLVREAGAEVFFTSRWLNAVLVQIEENIVPELTSLDFVDSVVYVAPGAKLSDTLSGYTVASTFQPPTITIGSSDLQLAMMNVDDMHSDGHRGEGMIVAVFDNGFLGVNQNQPFQHIFDNDQLVAVKDFIRNSGNPFQYADHGTSVLSLISGRYQDLMTGAAYEANVVLCVTEDDDSEYRIEEYNWLFAAEFCDSLGVDVINGSLGYKTFDDSLMDYSNEDLDGETTIVSRAAKMASDRGIIVVVSAGNAGCSSPNKLTAPADAEFILSVGSVNKDTVRSGFSSCGPTSDGRVKPEVVALGSGATKVDGSGNIGQGNGTSFASPQIAGLAAGLWQAHPEWTHHNVMSAIRVSAHQLGAKDNELGFGLPDYLNAIEFDPLSVNDVLTGKITVFPNPFSGGKVYVDFKGVSVREPVYLKVVDMKGATLVDKRIETHEIQDIMEIDLNSAKKAVYFLNITTGGNSKSVKLVKI